MRVKKEKKLFFFSYPHTLTFRLKRPVYRGFSGEGKCEGKLSPLTLTLTPSWISLATVRSVSLRLQNESQKKLTDCTDAHGVFDTDFFWPLFFDLYMDYKRICKRYRLRLVLDHEICRRPTDQREVISRIPRIHTGSQPKRFVRFVRLVFEKNIRVW